VTFATQEVAEGRGATRESTNSYTVAPLDPGTDGAH